MSEMIAPFSFEGPAYADRVGGKLTFHDWEHWTEEDQTRWFAERIRRQGTGSTFADGKPCK